MSSPPRLPGRLRGQMGLCFAHGTVYRHGRSGQNTARVLAVLQRAEHSRYSTGGVVMASECSKLLTAYLTWLKARITAKEINGVCEITTPFFDRHNDRLQIY